MLIPKMDTRSKKLNFAPGAAFVKYFSTGLLIILALGLEAQSKHSGSINFQYNYGRLTSSSIESSIGYYSYEQKHRPSFRLGAELTRKVGPNFELGLEVFYRDLSVSPSYLITNPLIHDAVLFDVTRDIRTSSIGYGLIAQYSMQQWAFTILLEASNPISIAKDFNNSNQVIAFFDINQQEAAALQIIEASDPPTGDMAYLTPAVKVACKLTSRLSIYANAQLKLYGNQEVYHLVVNGNIPDLGGNSQTLNNATIFNRSTTLGIGLSFRLF